MSPSPRKPRRSSRASEASEVTPASEAGQPAETSPAPEAPRLQFEADEGSEATRGASDADDAPPEAPVDEAEVEEPEAEAEEPEAEAPKPARRRRRAAASEEKPAAPKPSRRRAKRDPNLPPPVVRAQAKYVRSSPRKARLVCDHIRGKTVDEARAILAHTPRAVARDWSKLLESAVANAEHNHELVGEDLYVKSVHADDGPTIKRFRPRAMGRATKIRKRTSHLTIMLTPKD